MVAAGMGVCFLPNIPPPFRVSLAARSYRLRSSAMSAWPLSPAGVGQHRLLPLAGSAALSVAVCFGPSEPVQNSATIHCRRVENVLPDSGQRSCAREKSAQSLMSKAYRPDTTAAFHQRLRAQ